jgi:hypothetical protein
VVDASLVRRVLFQVTTKIKGLDYTGVETDIGKRWENGVNHHPKSLEFASHINEIERKHKSDFYLDFGGDGDNGETVLFLLDIFFEAQEKNGKK